MKCNTDPSLWLTICLLTGLNVSYPSLMSNKINPGQFFFSAWGKSCSLVWWDGTLNTENKVRFVSPLSSSVQSSHQNQPKMNVPCRSFKSKKMCLHLFIIIWNILACFPQTILRLHQSNEFPQLMRPMASSGMRTCSLCSISIIMQFLLPHKNHGAV